MGGNEDDIFYTIFRDYWPCWPLIASAISLGIVAIVGMIFNFGVIYVTIRTKSLRGTANFLLALTSLAELLHQSGHMLFLFTALSGSNFIRYAIAYYICALSLFGVHCQAISMTFTGLDRLISVLSPSFLNIKQQTYLSICTIICVLVGLYQSKIGFETAAENPNLMITGTVGDLFMGHYGTIYNALSLFFNSATIFIYVVVGIAIRIRSAKLSTVSAYSEQRNRRIFRSLAIIIGINVSGYFVLTLYHLFVIPRMGSPIWSWFVQQFLAVFLNISAGSNAPILYWTSEEYRREFRKEFGQLFGVLSSSNSSVAAQAALNTIQIIQQMSTSDIKFSRMTVGVGMEPIRATGHPNPRLSHQQNGKRF